MISRLGTVISSAGVLFVFAIAPAQTYEAAKEYSTTTNPNGFWRYGSYAPGESQSQSGFRLSTEASKNPEGTAMWMSPGSSTGTHILLDSSWIWLCPSPGGVRPALRFVAPERGNYKINNLFEGGSTDSDGHVSIFYHGLSLYLDDAVSGKGVASRKGYTGLIFLEKDEPVDFVVGLGKSGDSKRAISPIWLVIEKHKAPELDSTVPTDKFAAEGLKLFSTLLKEGKLDSKCLRYMAHKNRNMGDEADMLPSETARTFLDEAREHVKSIEVPTSFDGVSFPLQAGDILFIRFKWNKTGEAYLVKSVSEDKLRADLMKFDEGKRELSDVKGWKIQQVVGFYLLRPKSVKFHEILQKLFGN